MQSLPRVEEEPTIKERPSRLYHLRTSLLETSYTSLVPLAGDVASVRTRWNICALKDHPTRHLSSTGMRVT
ncbi:hypothetical protein CYMTET_13373 [Cymbomonas tetramitiformis]|uniref:Uncharacterized protein n=1 Tax=Cymbomonas tetramitiformis TaxID=36881 RepID=A0AAE0GJT2_9CHLO|nr:hypothetical protein CYMTET_13373 [Cymbomonas tetramitiformis]